MTEHPDSPGSTYRLQLHAGFGFDDAAKVCEYLARLGVSHVYCSPYLQAAAGSTHGYDVVDPQQLNAELGGAAGHAAFTGAVRETGLGQVLDIVPNHMAADPANRWWWDVLENGPASRYASHFDIDWESGGERSAYTVLAPILGDHYGRVIDAGELRVAREGGSFVVTYFDHRLPISPRTLDEVLGPAARRVGSGELAELGEGFGDLPLSRLTDQLAVVQRHDEKVAFEQRLEELCRADPLVADAIDAELDALGADADRLDGLLRRQNYRLAFWRTASEDLDYRRFFSIETLIGVRVEDPEVFADTHRLILELVRDGTLDGLRVDHVDGLRDPAGYLATLADATDHGYTVVEKILEPGEQLPGQWPVAGTSGYDFLIRVNNAFIDARSEGPLTRTYAAFTGDSTSYAEVVHEAKHHVMREELAAEVERVTGLAASICEDHRRHRDHTRRELRDALRELIAAFDVYRTYVRPGDAPSADDIAHVEAAVSTAGERRPDIDAELVAFLGGLALGGQGQEAELDFAQRFQQLTAPVMAKGVEDTAFYRYHRLISLNEVGGDPGVFGRSVDDFHRETQHVAARWPRSMLTLSTHDTKRSADVRARISVLSEIPAAWAAAVHRWADHNARHRRGGWKDRQAEYLLYQTLVGAWPLDADRAVEFMAKASKEAKLLTSWVDPVAEYDDGLEAFARGVVDDAFFRTDLEGFLDRYEVVRRGRESSLAQMALLLTCPGVPDLYQGTEVWDLSLVDPDNRRAVDYDARSGLLEQAVGWSAADALARSDDGGPKLWLIHRLLEERRRRPEVFDDAVYEPLTVDGPDAGSVIAFDRGGIVTAVRCRTDAIRPGTTVELPPGHWTSVLTGEDFRGQVGIDALVAGFPVAVLATPER